MTIIPEKILYTAHATATGGRSGTARSSDGALDVHLGTPKELGGGGGGTNPEQLFAAGYAACFIGAIKSVASGRTGGPKIALNGEVSIDSEVGIGTIPTGFGIQVALRISIPGLERALAESVVEAAHQVCPYSNATRGNIQVTLTVV
jgi:osmotically inducible protein OsmC